MTSETHSSDSSQSTTTDKEKLIKKLIYKIEKRGWKETTLLLQKLLPNSFMARLSLEELQLLENFLDETDMDIFKWLYYDYTIPESYKQLCSKILNQDK
jgi:succinate dehydrogenase flavin-adding protein (antitoxin of CptAB toxin-antitoxin module)